MRKLTILLRQYGKIIYTTIKKLAINIVKHIIVNTNEKYIKERMSVNKLFFQK